MSDKISKHRHPPIETRVPLGGKFQFADYLSDYTLMAQGGTSGPSLFSPDGPDTLLQ